VVRVHHHKSAAPRLTQYHTNSRPGCRAHSEQASPVAQLQMGGYRPPLATPPPPPKRFQTALHRARAPERAEESQPLGVRAYTLVPIPLPRLEGLATGQTQAAQNVEGSADRSQRGHHYSPVQSRVPTPA